MNRFVLLSACHANQEAFERNWSQHDAHGMWTYSLLEALKRCETSATARQVFALARLPFLVDDAAQSPQCIGDRDRLVFGVEARPIAAFVEVRQSDGQRLLLKGGHAYGLSEGSLWKIYPANTFDPEMQDPIGTAKIVQVSALSSEALIEKNAHGNSQTRKIAPGDWAYEAMPAYGELRLKVSCLAAVSGRERVRIEELIKASDFLILVSPEDSGNISVDIRDSKALILDEHGCPIDQFEINTVWTENVLIRLEKRARWRHGFTLKNRDPKSKVQSSVDVHLLRQDDNSWPRALPRVDGLPEFVHGDHIALELAHSFEGELFLYVLDFGMNDDVEQVHPAPGSEELVFPGEIKSIGIHHDDLLKVELPGGRQEGVGILKVFATTQPIDFDWLRTEIRRPRLRRSSTKLGRLLAMNGHAELPLVRSQEEDWGAVVCAFRLALAGR